MESMFTPVRELLNTNSCGPASCLSVISSEHDVVHGNGTSPTGLALGDENRPTDKVHVFPPESENLTAPHPRVKCDGDDGVNVISSARELREQSLFFI